MSISESVAKCVAILQAVNTDSEKFAALFAVTKLVKGKDCTPAAKKLLFETIGAKFLKRLLSSDSVPVDCPPQVYKSVALSILSAFCGESELATHPEMVGHIPALLEIVSQADDDAPDMLIIVSEAYTCLKSIAQHLPGQKALLEQEAIPKMCDIYAEKSFQTDEALNILVTLAGRFGPAAWDATDTTLFHAILQKIALDFETDHTERKFKLCTILQALLQSCRREVISTSAKEESWPLSIYKGLSDILGSKIGKNQRDPALKLAAVIMDLLGAEWTMSDKEKPKIFLLLLIQLASIEVRMQLEGKQLKTVLANSDLVTACFTILELFLGYIITDQLDLDQKEKQSLYTALKGAFGAVISLLNAVSKMKTLTDMEEKIFVCAVVRVLTAWLAQETTAMRPQFYAVLPYMLSVANDTFYSYRNRKLAEKARSKGGKMEESTSSNSSIVRDPMSEMDLLRLLLPALCYLAVEEDARKILLQNKQDEVLFECLSYHWTIVHYKKPPVPKSERLKALQEGNRTEDLDIGLLEEMKDSRIAMVSICNVLMNITVLEAKLVEESPTFISLLKFIFNNLPELKQIPENLVLHGHLAVLGLLLLKQQAKCIKKNDFSICRYIQATIRFLWDAYIIDEGNDPTELVVAMSYKEHWMELMELWFLGMQTMAGVLQVIPWLSQFTLESGWAEEIIETLKKVKIGGLQPNVKSAFEDLLCHLVKAEDSVAAVLKKADALTVCRNHRMMELGKYLFGD